ncbi:MAG: hypothetical protein EON47_11200, partial [Acetobacteraceae bacterium]
MADQGVPAHRAGATAAAGRLAAGVLLCGFGTLPMAAAQPVLPAGPAGATPALTEVEAMRLPQM